MGEQEKLGERWKAAIVNLSEMGGNVDSLQKLLAKKAVFVDEETYAKATLISEQARAIKICCMPTLLHRLPRRCPVRGALKTNSLAPSICRQLVTLQQRVESLERELDAAITAAARARSEKRQAEAAQRASEMRTQDITKELENTTKVFKLHMEELRAKQEVISRKDSEIKVLEAIIQTLGGKEAMTGND